MIGENEHVIARSVHGKLCFETSLAGSQRYDRISDPNFVKKSRSRSGTQIPEQVRCERTQLYSEGIEKIQGKLCCEDQMRSRDRAASAARVVQSCTPVSFSVASRLKIERSAALPAPAADLPDRPSIPYIFLPPDFYRQF